MDRLIKESDVSHMLKEYFKTKLDKDLEVIKYNLELRDLMNKIPTAYDVDGVLHQIDVASRNSGRRSGRIDTELVKQIIRNGVK